MPSDHRAEVEDLLADYRRSRERLAATREELSAITETASAEGVRVTVGPQGALRDLVLADDAYQRHRPDQLAALIVRLTSDAARSAARRAADVLAEVLPEDADPALLLGGHTDSESEAVRRNGSRGVDDNVNDSAEEDFSDASWLQQGPAERT